MQSVTAHVVRYSIYCHVKSAASSLVPTLALASQCAALTSNPTSRHYTTYTPISISPAKSQRGRGPRRGPPRNFVYRIPPVSEPQSKLRLRLQSNPNLKRDNDELDADLEALKESRPDLLQPKRYVSRHEAPTELLEQELEWIAHNQPSPKGVQHILRILIEERGLKPQNAHYEALILGNCHSQWGSVEAVKSVLAEMEREQISMNSSIYLAVLKVLAVHPDYLLRSEILNRMQQQWIQPSSEVRNYVVASMIRDGQIELALQEIQQMQSGRTDVYPWLYILLVHNICEQRDFAALLGLLYKMKEDQVDLPMPTLLYLLDEASREGSLEVTDWLWQEMVEVMYLIPGTECCLNTLRLAAAQGDTRLAESVILVLKDRNPTLAEQHQKLVEKAYVKAGKEREPNRLVRGNLFPIFSKQKGLDTAYFDPKLALAKQRMRKI